MSHTFTATPDAVISGGAVQLTEPDDGDLASATAQNTPDEKNANLIKKLVNQALFGGTTPSILDANAANGLLFASELDTSGAPSRARIYSLPGVPRTLVLTINASWDGTHWNRDVVGVDAIMFSLTPLASNDDDRAHIRIGIRDTSLGAQWNDAQWDYAKLTEQGAATAAGIGLILAQTPVQVGSGGSAPAFTSSWANDTSVGTFGPAMFWKSPIGECGLQGQIVGGSSTTAAFALPAAYRPATDKQFSVPTKVTNQFATVYIAASNGAVEVFFSGSGSVSLDGIRWR